MESIGFALTTGHAGYGFFPIQTRTRPINYNSGHLSINLAQGSNTKHEPYGLKLASSTRGAIGREASVAISYYLHSLAGVSQERPGCGSIEPYGPYFVQRPRRAVAHQTTKLLFFLRCPILDIRKPVVQSGLSFIQ